MVRWRRSAVLAAIALVSLVGIAFPARAQNGSLEVVDVSTAGHPEVRLVVSAPREFVGREIPAEAFEVSEDGRARGVSVERIPNDTLEIALVIDTSGSMAGDALAAAQTAATNFVSQMPPGTRIAVVGFGEQVTITQPLSEDATATSAAIESLTAQGETALYDAVVATANEFTTKSGARRIVVLLSDGGDTVSASGLEGAIGALGSADFEFVAISLGSGEANVEALNALAAAARGNVVSADEPEALAGVFDSIAAQVVNQYELTYVSESEGPTTLAVAFDYEGASASASIDFDLPKLSDRPGGASVPEGGRGGREIVTPSASFLESGWTLGLGAVAIGGAFVVLGVAIAMKSEPRRRLSREWGRLRGVASKSALTGIADRAGDIATRALERGNRQGMVGRALESSGVAMRPEEYLVLAAGGVLAAFAVGFTVMNPIAGFALGAVAGAGAVMALRILAARRRKAFGEQMSDTLVLLAGTMRAGYGLIQAVDAVAREAPEPTCLEFRRAIVESRLGRDLSDALDDVAQRMECEDFQWVVQAIRIHREIGGDLAEVLDQVGETIRDRNKIRRQVQALSAEGRLSARILMALPFVLGFIIRILNPEYISTLTTHPAGKVMLGAAGGLLITGYLWLRRIIRPEF